MHSRQGIEPRHAPQRDGPSGPNHPCELRPRADPRPRRHPAPRGPPGAGGARAGRAPGEPQRRHPARGRRHVAARPAGRGPARAGPDPGAPGLARSGPDGPAAAVPRQGAARPGRPAVRRDRPPLGRGPDPGAGAGLGRRRVGLPRPLSAGPDLAGGLRGRLARHRSLRDGRRRGPPAHRVRPRPDLPVRRGLERHGDRGGPQRRAAVVPRPAVPRLRHPRAGPRPLPGQPGEADRRRRLPPGADRPGDQPEGWPAARPQLRLTPERLAGPPRIHGQHGHTRVDVDLDPRRRRALGPDLLPPRGAPGRPLRSQDRVRLPRPGARAPDRRQGAARGAGAPPRAEGGAGPAPGRHDRGEGLRRRPGRPRRRPARVRHDGEEGPAILHEGHAAGPPIGRTPDEGRRRTGSPAGWSTRGATTSSRPNRWPGTSRTPGRSRASPAGCSPSPSRSCTGATCSGSGPR